MEPWRGILEPWRRIFLCDGHACPKCTEASRAYCVRTSDYTHAVPELELDDDVTTVEIPLWWVTDGN